MDTEEYLASTGRVRNRVMAEMRKQIKTSERVEVALDKTKLLGCVYRVRNLLDFPELREVVKDEVSLVELFLASSAGLKKLMPNVISGFLGSAENETELVSSLKNLVDIVSEIDNSSLVQKLSPEIRSELMTLLNAVVVPRDATTCAAMLYVVIFGVSGRTEICQYPELSQLALVRAKMHLKNDELVEVDFRELFDYFVDFLPPRTPNADERMVHYALSSLLVLLSVTKFPITDEELDHLLPCICATIAHPVSMVAAISDNVMAKLVSVASELQVKKLVADVVRTLEAGRGRNLLLISLVREVAADPWPFLIDGMMQILSDSNAASSAASLIAAVSNASEDVRTNLAGRLIKLVKSREKGLSVRAIDRLFASLKSCGPKVIADVVAKSSILSLPLRMAICRLARTSGLAEWRDCGLVADAGTVLLRVAEIRDALVSSNIALSLDAVGVVVFSARPAEPPSATELDLIDQFIRGGGLFHASSVIDCRTKVVKTLQFFLTRAKSIASWQNKRNGAIDREAVSTFISAMKTFLVQVVACTTSSLEASQPAAELLVDMAGDLTESDVRVLFNSGLRSPWERTRLTVAEVLRCRTRISGLDAETNKFLQRVMLPSLIESRRAQDVLLVETVMDCLLMEVGDIKDFSLCQEVMRKAGASETAGDISVMELACVRAVLRRFKVVEEFDVASLMKIAELKLLPLAGQGADCRGHLMDAIERQVQDDGGETSWLGGHLALETLAEFGGLQNISDLLGRCLLLQLSVKHMGAIDALQHAVFRLGERGGLDVCRFWLDSLLELLVHGKNSSGSLPLPPALRRSYGLGLALCALMRSEIATCPRAGRATLVERSVETLTSHIRNCVEKASEDSAVHAVNMLHTIVRNSSLTAAVNRHIPEIFALGAACMQNADWKLRTAGNLLFVNCARRLIGGDDELNSKPVAIAEFFARFPGLVDIMLDLTAAQRPETALAGLLVVSRLHAHMSQWPGKQRFVEILRNSLRSPVWQVRQVAGRLFVRTCEISGLPELLEKAGSTTSANEAHGCLLALQFAVTEKLTLPASHGNCLHACMRKFSKCPPISLVVSQLVDTTKAPSVASSAFAASDFRTPVFTRNVESSSDIQTLRQTLDAEDADSVVKQKIAERVFSPESEYTLAERDPVVVRELLRSALPWLGGTGLALDVVALAQSWTRGGFIEGVKTLMRSFSSEVNDAEVLRYLAAQEDDAEARWLAVAGRGVQSLPLDLAMALMLDENLEVRTEACGGVNPVQAVKSALGGWRDKQAVEKTKEKLAVKESAEGAVSQTSTNMYEKEPEGLYTERWILGKLDLFR